MTLLCIKPQKHSNNFSVATYQQLEELSQFGVEVINFLGDFEVYDSQVNLVEGKISVPDGQAKDVDEFLGCCGIFIEPISNDAERELIKIFSEHEWLVDMCEDLPKGYWD